ncbi:ABC transporter ATP-binding protein [Capsulimonas corticalis]|uniref:ABC transporter ATP-binding protein n=1 Tax=Capsulimonas corticalis TaxID=2219043 RepID=A0A402CYV3_9BACT|nr:ABC transporter ATP-binding protein [Capsulimonas corticalis]
MPVLRADGLVKAYKGRSVVNGVSVEVHPGEIVGLLGPNGAGKTTSFYMLVGLVRPDSGRVLLDDKDITHLPMYQRAHQGIGYLAQETSVFRKLTVAENIMLILEMQPGLTAADRKERLEDLLTRLGLGPRRNSQALHLSGGEKRRVEIARVLATRPKFILLDEPFTGVDPIAIEDLQSIVADLREDGIGILITDHHVDATLKITDRVYIVFEGEIKTSGSPEELVKNPIARKYYLGDGGGSRGQNSSQLRPPRDEDDGEEQFREAS